MADGRGQRPEVFQRFKTNNKSLKHRKVKSDSHVPVHSFTGCHDHFDEQGPKTIRDAACHPSSIICDGDAKGPNAVVNDMTLEHDMISVSRKLQSELALEDKVLPRIVKPDAPSKLGLHASVPTPPGSITPGPNLIEELSGMEEIPTKLGARDFNIPLNNDADSPDSHVQNSEVGMSDTDKAAWQRIQQSRVDIWSLRSQVHGVRARLREMQMKKSVSEDLLFQRIRSQELLQSIQPPVFPSGKEKTISELMDDCQDAKDRYGPSEYECNALEDQLSGQEFRLAKLEMAFYNRPTQSTSPVNEDSVGGTLRSVSPELAKSFGDLESMDTHPLVSAFLSSLGDLDLLRERYEDHVNDRTGLEAERDTRQRMHLNLDPDDQAWLDNSEKEETRLLEELQHAEEQVAAMRKDCLERRLLDENDEATNFESQVQVSFGTELDMDPRNQVSEYVKYPSLLPHPGIKFENPQPDEESDITTTRINEWLLQRLRSSPLEVRLLASTFEGKCGKINERWEILVLAFWHDDDTVTATKKHRLYSSSLTTHATPRSSNVSELYHF